MQILQRAPLLAARVDAYFIYIKGEYRIQKTPFKSGSGTTDIIEKVIWDRVAEPASLMGLALFLGFNSRQEFEAYAHCGKCKTQLKKAILRIEYEYEKRLLQPAPAGVIFALKSMGWTDKTKTKQRGSTTMRIVIVETGPLLAGNEKDVVV